MCRFTVCGRHDGRESKLCFKSDFWEGQNEIREGQNEIQRERKNKLPFVKCSGTWSELAWYSSLFLYCNWNVKNAITLFCLRVNYYSCCCSQIQSLFELPRFIKRTSLADVNEWNVAKNSEEANRGRLDGVAQWHALVRRRKTSILWKEYCR